MRTQLLCAKWTYSANRRHIDMLDALLRLDLRVDPRSRSRRRCSGLVLGACVRRAVCGLTSHRAALTKRLRFSPRGRSRATVCIETRAYGAFRLVAVEARSRASFVGHGCAWLRSKNWCCSESPRAVVAWSREPPVVCSLAPAVVPFHAAARANHGWPRSECESEILGTLGKLAHSPPPNNPLHTRIQTPSLD